MKPKNSAPHSSQATDNIPRHIAVIMDGNGRWAKEHGEARLSGHRAGSRSVRMMVEECRRVGVRYLTLFSFSSENWGRSPQEVAGLMTLFKEHLDSELRDHELMKNGVRLRAIGELSRLPLPVRTLLNRVMELTKDNTELDLILAMSYGAREEIVTACRKIAEEAASGQLRPKDITEAMFSERLWTAEYPDPDLLIRTGGEMRISNFLLWQMAYTELMMVEEYWPAFTAETFRQCLDSYAQRERRFGLTSEQVEAKSKKTATA